LIRNIKKIALWLFIIMICSFSISIVLFKSAGVNLRDFTYIDNDFSGKNNIKGKFKENINAERNFDIQYIEEINVNTVSTDIRFIPEARDDIRIHFHGIVASNNEVVLPELITEKQATTLQIKIDYKNSSYVGYYSSKLSLDIYIPEKYSKNINTKTTSGDIDLGSLNIKNINLSSVSGDIKSESLYTEKTRLTSTSGDIKIEDFLGELSAKTTSGDLLINVKSIDNDININSISGDIKITLPDKAEFYLESTSTSGDVGCDFPISIQGKLSDKKKEGKVGNGNNRITASTVSGDIKISK